MSERDELDDGSAPTGPSPSHTSALVACTAAGLLVLAGGGVVVVMRIGNPDAEPEGQNWWLVALFVVSLTYAVVGAALLTRARGRVLGACFVVIGAAATVTVIAMQYQAFAQGDGTPAWPGLRTADRWATPLCAWTLAALAPWQLLRRPWRDAPWCRLAWRATAAVIVVLVATATTEDLRPITLGATWIVALAATAATVLHGLGWWRSRRSGDPLPGWLLAGTLAAWLAVVPRSLDLAEWRLPGRDVVWPLLFVATVPLLVVGAVVDAIRDVPSRYHGVSHRVVEWTVLTGGIVVVYTGLVAGLGTLVGGSGPTWFLVATTGAIALALEPGRQHVRRLADKLVYGARDDPLAVVQRIVDHVGADAGDHLLDNLVESLQRELRLDAVAFDLRVHDGWQRVAETGPATARRRIVMLHHRHDRIGRIVLGWEDGPSLRQRDEEVLRQLVGPLSLAVGWVRLTADLRRSSLAIVSAREEERRRLRRDLHDGLGPALTGVSLGLRTSLHRLDRVDVDAVAPSRALLARVADEVDSVVVELKRIVRDLRPTALDQLGLAGAVAEFTRTFGDELEIHLVLPPAPFDLPAAVEVATYRIVTEAVTNVVRHARAESCWLTIVAGATVEIDVVDDGIGLDGSPPGVGLTAMRERAALLGGTVSLLPNRPCGTHVHVQLPAALP